MLKPLPRLEFAHLSVFFRTFNRLTLPTSKRARVQFLAVCFVRTFLTSSASLMILLPDVLPLSLAYRMQRRFNRCCSLLIIALDVAAARPVDRQHC